MARRRRPAPRTSVEADGARIIVPLDGVTDPDGGALALREVTRWLARIDAYPGELGDAGDGAAVVLDRFAWDLHLADVGHATDTHDGDPFFEAAVAAGAVAVYVVAGVDPRRSTRHEIVTAARRGDLAGALVPAFAVDVLQS